MPTEPAYPDATKAGPVQSIDGAPDLFPASAAPAGDLRYSQSPRERDAWQYPVDAAGPVIAACGRGASDFIADMNAVDGVYDTGTAQPGLPIYGMADGR